MATVLNCMYRRPASINQLLGRMCGRGKLESHLCLYKLIYVHMYPSTDLWLRQDFIPRYNPNPTIFYRRVGNSFPVRILFRVLTSALLICIPLLFYEFTEIWGLFYGLWDCNNNINPELARTGTCSRIVWVLAHTHTYVMRTKAPRRRILEQSSHRKLGFVFHWNAHMTTFY